MRRTDLECTFTQHAMLVVWGQFAQAIGLIQALEAIPLHRKTYIHRPQTEVLEVFLAILAGLPHLKDISRSDHPLDQDPAVAWTWGQPVWADYSGVSRALQGLTLDEACQIVQATEVKTGVLPWRVQSCSGNDCSAYRLRGECPYPWTWPWSGFIKVRSEAAIFLQEHFAAFAADFVRWAAWWLQERCFQSTVEEEGIAAAGVKELVQVAAHTSAWVIWQRDSCVFRFADYSVFAGTFLQVKNGWAVQLPLPLFKSCDFAPI